MSLPVSAGDVIAVSILIKDLIKALDDSRGSAAEYQEIVRELCSLDKALLEVEHLARTCETTVELNALACAARRAAGQCRSSISAFLERIKSYSRSLGDEGSGSRLRDAAKKFQWTLIQKDEVKKFRTEVNGHTASINMLLITTCIHNNRVTSRNVEGRLEEAEKSHGNFSTEMLSLLSETQRKLQDSRIQLEEHSRQFDCQKKYFATLSSELKDSMSSILTANREGYRALLDFQLRVPREFKPCWIQEPTVLTDALGRIMPIHIELVNSWEVFNSVLAARFIGHPGQSKIAREEIVFQDRYLVKDIKSSQSFETCFLPGRHIDMSMVFKQKNMCTSCPRCGLNANCISGVMTQCSGCAMCFQRVEDIGENSKIRPSRSAQGQSTTNDKKTSIQAPNNREVTANSAEEDEEEEDVKAFQRVRLLLQPSSRISHEQKDTAQSQASPEAFPLTSLSVREIEVMEQNESSPLLTDTSTEASLMQLSDDIKCIMRSFEAELVQAPSSTKIQTRLRQLQASRDFHKRNIGRLLFKISNA